MRYLVDVPKALPPLTEWFIAEWEPYYGPKGPGNAETDLRESMRRDVLPICVIALDVSGELLGTISLKAESISHRELTPWGAAFLVAPGRRGQGVGTALLAALEAKARELGFNSLYMSTDAANSIAERRGWRAIDEAESLRGTVTVYKCEL